jgi:hypothetical protein
MKVNPALIAAFSGLCDTIPLIVGTTPFAVIFGTVARIGWASLHSPQRSWRPTPPRMMKNFTLTTEKRHSWEVFFHANLCGLKKIEVIGGRSLSIT